MIDVSAHMALNHPWIRERCRAVQTGKQGAERTLNCLRQAHHGRMPQRNPALIGRVATVRDARLLTDEELLSIPSFGATCLRTWRAATGRGTRA